MKTMSDEVLHEGKTQEQADTGWVNLADIDGEAAAAWLRQERNREEALFLFAEKLFELLPLDG